MGKLIGREPAEEIEYPESDGKPMAETDLHRKAMFDVIERLAQRYVLRSDVYVTGNLLVYYVERKPAFCLAPDCFVAFGVAPGDRRTYRTWEEGVYPSVVFENTSAQSEAEDTTTKFTTYRDVWGVRELFYFDPTGDYLPEPVVGYRSVRGRFRPIVPTRGRLTSHELGITLAADGPRLDLRDGKTGDALLTVAEAKAAQLETEIDRLQAEIAALQRKAGN